MISCARILDDSYSLSSQVRAGRPFSALMEFTRLKTSCAFVKSWPEAIGSGVGTGVGSGVGTGVGSGVGTGVGSGVGTGVGSGVGTGVGSGVGTGVGSGVGTGVGSGVGTEVGSGVGTKVGSGVGTEVGSGVGAEVGSGVGTEVGSGVGTEVGSSVGAGVGVTIGSSVTVGVASVLLSEVVSEETIGASVASGIIGDEELLRRLPQPVNKTNRETIRMIRNVFLFIGFPPSFVGIEHIYLYRRDGGVSLGRAVDQ